MESHKPQINYKEAKFIELLISWTQIGMDIWKVTVTKTQTYCSVLITESNEFYSRFWNTSMSVFSPT